MNDSISRTKMMSLLAMRADYAANDDIHDELVTLINKVRDMPAVDAVPVRHAKWVYEGKMYYSDYNTHNTWSCSGCGCSEFTPTRFCPNCGARMDEEWDNEVTNAIDTTDRC